MLPTHPLLWKTHSLRESQNLWATTILSLNPLVLLESAPNDQGFSVHARHNDGKNHVRRKGYNLQGTITLSLTLLVVSERAPDDMGLIINTIQNSWENLILWEDHGWKFGPFNPSLA